MAGVNGGKKTASPPQVTGFSNPNPFPLPARARPKEAGFVFVWRLCGYGYWLMAPGCSAQARPCRRDCMPLLPFGAESSSPMARVACLAIVALVASHSSRRKASRREESQGAMSTIVRVGPQKPISPQRRGARLAAAWAARGARWAARSGAGASQTPLVAGDVPDRGRLLLDAGVSAGDRGAGGGVAGADGHPGVGAGDAFRCACRCTGGSPRRVRTAMARSRCWSGCSPGGRARCWCWC